MSHSTNAVQHPLFVGFAAYGCSHLMLFSLIGLLALPLPALWWAALALIPSWLLFRWLERFGRADLAQLVGVQSVAFAGGVLGLHGRELFCLTKALV
jgi:hypothetical protein